MLENTWNLILALIVVIMMLGFWSLITEIPLKKLAILVGQNNLWGLNASKRKLPNVILDVLTAIRKGIMKKGRQIMGHKKLIYLASVYGYPYDETVTKQVKEKRYRKVLKCAEHIYFKYEDIYVYTPIGYTHTLCKYTKMPNSDRNNYYTDFGIEMLSKADELWILDMEDWDKSRGIKAEIEYAQLHDMPIKMVTLRGRTYIYGTI